MYKEYIDQPTYYHMQRNIDRMVTKCIFFPEIIIDRKTDVGQIPVPWFSFQGRFFQSIPGKFRHVNIGIIFRDKIDVIKYKWGVKRVWIDKDSGNNQN